MPIKKIDNFYATEDMGVEVSLGIETNRIQECIKEIQLKKYLGCFGNPGFGFQQDNLDFFEKIPWIRQVWFWDINLKNIDGLYFLKDLAYFGIQDKRPEIDFSKISKLEKMVWVPHKKDKGIDTLTNLSKIDIWRWKTSTKDYNGINLPPSIKSMGLYWCNPISLDGMPYLPNLEDLCIECSRNLISINNIFNIAPNLKKLVIGTCPHLIIDLDVSKFTNMDHVWINGKTFT